MVVLLLETCYIWHWAWEMGLVLQNISCTPESKSQQLLPEEMLKPLSSHWLDMEVNESCWDPQNLLTKKMMTDILRTKSNDENNKFLRDQNFTPKGYFVSRQVVCWLSLYNVSETSRKALPIAGLCEEINAFSLQWHVRTQYVITGFNWMYKHDCMLPHFNHISSGM